jgi:hypothetical protein
MKLIDRLLMQAKEILTAIHFVYDMNEDNFIEALGLDPEKYRIDYPNGEHGYDVMKALYERSDDLWKNYEEDGGENDE